MVVITTKLLIADNSGARTSKCIHIYKRKKFGSIGDFLLSTIKTYNPQKKIKKGELFLSLILRTKYNFNIKNSYVKFSQNAAIILNKKRKPLSTRLFGPSIRKIRFINKKIFLMLKYIV